MDLRKVLKNYGEKKAVASVSPRSIPFAWHQPKPPAKIMELVPVITTK